MPSAAVAELLEKVQGSDGDREMLGHVDRLRRQLLAEVGTEASEVVAERRTKEVAATFAAVVEKLKTTAALVRRSLNGDDAARELSEAAVQDLMTCIANAKEQLDTAARSPHSPSRSMHRLYDTTLDTTQPIPHTEQVQPPEVEKLLRRIQELEYTNEELIGEVALLSTAPLPDPHDCSDSSDDRDESPMASSVSLSPRSTGRATGKEEELHRMLADLQNGASTLREQLTADKDAELASLKAKVVELASELYEKDSLLQKVSANSEALLDPDMTANISSTVARVEEQLSSGVVSGDQQSVKAKYRDDRKHRVESLYSSMFKGHGMDLIAAAVRTVYAIEYAARDVGVSEFCEEFHRRFLRQTESMLVAFPSIAEAYISDCNKLGYKPNSGVLKQLRVMDDTAISEVGLFDLSNNLLSDTGLHALLPTLQKLSHMTRLNLSSNGLQNNAVKLLAEELRHHPSITSVDLSNNRLSRSAGKEVIQLLISNPAIREVSLDGTRIDAPLRERIKDRLRKASSP